MAAVTQLRGAAKAAAERKAAREAEEAASVIPGQQDIDGGEVPSGREVIEEQADPGEGETGLPPRPGDEPAEEVSSYVEEIRVDGTTQVALDFGGKRPMTATLSLSGKATVDGFYRKGDRLRGSFEAVVVGVAGKDKLDKPTGIVVEAAQAHTAKMVDIRIDA
jgi:hypothetical protein